MYRNRIKEAKQAKGISAKTMSAASKLGIQEETISRFLSGKTADPGTNITLDLGETVGLKPYEIFMDAQTAAEFQAYLELKYKTADAEAANVRLLAENDTLSQTNATLVGENSTLQRKISHLEETIAHLKEIIANKEQIIALMSRLLGDK